MWTDQLVPWPWLAVIAALSLMLAATFVV